MIFKISVTSDKEEHWIDFEIPDEFLDEPIEKLIAWRVHPAFALLFDQVHERK